MPPPPPNTIITSLKTLRGEILVQYRFVEFKGRIKRFYAWKQFSLNLEKGLAESA